MRATNNETLSIEKAVRIYGLCIALLLFSCTERVEDQFVYDKSSGFIFRDVEYGTASRQKMNVFLPAGRNSSTRIVILIHGGGWTTGDKNDFDTFATAFSSAGIAAVTVNYRYADISSGIDYTDILEDIDKAIQCVSDSSSRYSVSAEKICLLGHSAGGHLALLYAYRNNPGGLADKVVSLAGPTDLTDPQLLNITGINDLVNALTDNNPDKRIDASPVSHAKNITTRMYHGKTDAVVPYQQSQKLFDKIHTLNSTNSLLLIENCGHGFNLAELSKILTETVEMLRQ